MKNFLSCVAFLGWSLVVALPASSVAQEKGLADLNKATELQLNAETLADLEKVAQLCEDALEKGLNAENQTFAKELLASTLMDHARKLSQAVLDQQPPNPRWPAIRGFAVRDLDKAIKHQPDLAEAHLLRARLLVLPGGDRKEAHKSASKAAELLKDEKPELAKALVIRGQCSEEKEQQLKDYAAAIEADPSCTDAWQARAMVFVEAREFDKAVADLKKLVEASKGDVRARFALADALTSLEKYEEALEQIAQGIADRPDVPIGYLLRARVYLMQNLPEKALAALDQAIKIEPRDLSALLLRAQLHLEEDRYGAAREDVDRVLQLRADLPQAILLRSTISAAEKNFPAAMNDIRLLLKQQPDNVGLKIQLAQLCSAGGWPRESIRFMTKIIEANPENWQAFRQRGDALLNIGKHAEAVADYEKALKLRPESDGVLNNLAWVLATSPDDKVRNAKRAIELGTKACEVTDFKASHILSTLAAGYAEAGDFENAIKWSTKAVELGEGESKQQLQQELESYKQKKPWRERQETEEKPNPPSLDENTTL